jgi:hypothetical protein
MSPGLQALEKTDFETLEGGAHIEFEFGGYGPHTR